MQIDGGVRIGAYWLNDIPFLYLLHRTKLPLSKYFEEVHLGMRSKVVIHSRRTTLPLDHPISNKALLRMLQSRAPIYGVGCDGEWVGIARQLSACRPVWRRLTASPHPHSICTTLTSSRFYRIFSPWNIFFTLKWKVQGEKFAIDLENPVFCGIKEVCRIIRRAV